MTYLPSLNTVRLVELSSTSNITLTGGTPTSSLVSTSITTTGSNKILLLASCGFQLTSDGSGDIYITFALRRDSVILDGSQRELAYRGLTPSTACIFTTSVDFLDSPIDGAHVYDWIYQLTTGTSFSARNVTLTALEIDN